MLPADLRRAVAQVLEQRRMPGADLARLLGALDAGPDGAALEAVLEVRRPARPAWLAARDGYWLADRDTFVLQASAALAGAYAPDEGPAEGGGRPYTPDDGSYSRAWRYGPLDGRTARPAPGSEVRAGDALSDGEPDPHDLLLILGERLARAHLGERLQALAALGPEQVEALLGPMFDVVEVTEAAGAHLRRGQRVTGQRFEVELGRVVLRALQGLPPSADPRLHELAALEPAACFARLYEANLFDALHAAGVRLPMPVGQKALTGYRALATLDASGKLPRPGAWHELGAFEVRSGRLRIVDPGRWGARAGLAEVPAPRGAWRAESRVVELPRWGLRVAELRAWAGPARPDFDDAVEDAGNLIAVDSGLAGLFDAGAAASSPESCFDASRRAPGLGATSELGAWSQSGLGDGAYACKLLRDADGAVVAAYLDFGLD